MRIYGLALSGLVLLASSAFGEGLPLFQLKIRIESLSQTRFAIQGNVTSPAGPLKIVLLPQHDYHFRDGNEELTIKSGSTVKGPMVSFEGLSQMRQNAKCSANGQEVYCLNRAVPNPEVESDGAYYEVQFDLPEGYSGLTASSQVPQGEGLAFQVARLQAPVVEPAGPLQLECHWPVGFTPAPAYLEWMKARAEQWHRLLGPLGFQTIRVGAIHRGGERELSGSPSGNLVLFSRSALGGPLHSPSLQQLGLRSDITDALRKLVIAHELSHFWFGQKYKGEEGWMVEGIPQYLALWSVMHDSGVERQDLIRFFKAAGAAASGPIPGVPLDDGAGFIKAYYQAPIALWEIGEEIGHESLVKLLTGVFSSKPSPRFEDFDRAFQAAHPSKEALWRKSWRIEN